MTFVCDYELNLVCLTIGFILFILYYYKKKDMKRFSI
jgi:hypothetical protein